MYYIVQCDSPRTKTHPHNNLGVILLEYDDHK